jgi:hypothetical protein
LDAHERFDTIVLDPPRLAGSRDHIQRALGAYHKLNYLAMRMFRKSVPRRFSRYASWGEYACEPRSANSRRTRGRARSSKLYVMPRNRLPEMHRRPRALRCNVCKL